VWHSKLLYCIYTYYYSCVGEIYLKKGSGINLSSYCLTEREKRFIIKKIETSLLFNDSVLISIKRKELGGDTSS